MKKLFLLWLCFVFFCGFSFRDPFIDENVMASAEDYEFRELTTAEKIDLVRKIKAADGVKYVWNSQTRADGVDCSGLIVWAYAMQGYLGFKKDEYVVYDVSSSEMFSHDVNAAISVTDTRQLLDYESGDFLFFDANADGKIEHVAIFMYYDEELDNVWIWDATRLTGKVSYRKMENFLKKNPKIGRPMIPVKIESLNNCSACK